VFLGRQRCDAQARNCRTNGWRQYVDVAQSEEFLHSLWVTVKFALLTVPVGVALGLGLAVVLSAAVARSLRSTIVACVPPFVGAVWAMGVVGLCGVPVNLLTSVVPSLALVVGTCDSIHFIEDMRRSTRAAGVIEIQDRKLPAGR
jgi:ABC-type sugar transport system permease subunit